MGSLVDDALAGLALTNPGVLLLKEERAVVRQDHDLARGRVKVVSGGASGHEPYPAGYVGPGMLTAAVVGDVCAAPPPLVVVRVVRRVVQNPAEGVLLVVCDNPGDRLSLAVAAEQLSAEGMRVELVAAGGMAGAVLVFKLAGAMAEWGMSLDEVSVLCSRAVAGLATVDIDMNQLPVLDNCQELFDVGFESGDLGINGEEEKMNQEPAVRLPGMVEAVQKQFADLPSLPSQECLITLLVNNSGQMTKLTEQLFTMKATRQFQGHGYKVRRLYSGNFASSSKKKGFSVAALKVFCTDVVDLLDAPTSVPAWPRTPCPICRHDTVSSDQLADPSSGSSVGKDSLGHGKDGSCPVLEISDGRVLEVVLCATRAVVACEEQLNLLDRRDRDCGTTLRQGAEAIAEAILAKQVSCETPSSLLSCLGHICGSTMGGVSGALYCVLFAAAAQELTESSSWTASSWAVALRTGSEAVGRCGAVTVGCGTMLDSLAAAATAAADWCARRGPEDRVAVARRAAEAAELAALRTGGPSELRQHPDAGAHAVGIWLRAVCEGLQQVYKAER